MLHGLPSMNVAFRGARITSPVMPGDPSVMVDSLRALHSLMLSYAACRRRAAANDDERYWKDAEVQAVRMARAVRRQPGFRALP